MDNLARTLKAEYDDIRKKGLWGRYAEELRRAKEWYESELRTNRKIGEPITRGEHWQEVLRRLALIMDLPEKIINDAVKASDENSGTPA